MTATLTIEYHRPWLYRKQTEAIFCAERIACIEASTKAGKTVGCILWLLELALCGGQAGWNYWWVAPVATQADIAFSRLVRFLPRGTFTANRTLRTVVLQNGAIIWFKGGDRPDSLYGDDVHGAVIDEASRLKETAWHAVRSTLTATRGPIRIIGNVKGRRNWFYTLARRAEASKAQGRPSDMAYHRLVAYDAVQAGVLDADEIASAKRDLPERVFKELYLAIASDDGGNPFGLDKIAQCQRPLSNKQPVAWGWDLAKSQNYTVGIGLDEDNTIARFHRFQRSWRDTKSIIIAETGIEAALVDSTGVGDPIMEDLQQNGGSNFEGYKFTEPSKQQLMEGLMMAVQKSDVGIPPKIESPEPGDPAHVMLELETFEYQYRPGGGVRYRAPEGFFDDCVMSLALAIACKAQRRGLDVWSNL